MFKSIGGGGGGNGGGGGTFFQNPTSSHSFIGDKLNQSYNQYRTGAHGPDRYARSKPVKIKKHQYRHHPNGGELTINLTRNEPRLVICNGGGSLLNQQLNSVNNHIGQLSIGHSKFTNRLSATKQQVQPQVHSSRYKFLNNNFHTTSSKSNSNGNNNHHHKHHYHHHNHHHNNMKKQLSAPYNTTQYIMYDYSKRKSNENAFENERGQFSHDWNMALAAADDVEECKSCTVVVSVGESSSTEPVDDVQRPSSSAMDDEHHQQNDSMNIISNNNNKFPLSKSDTNLFSAENPTTSSTNLSVSV